MELDEAIDKTLEGVVGKNVHEGFLDLLRLFVFREKNSRHNKNEYVFYEFRHTGYDEGEYKIEDEPYHFLNLDPGKLPIMTTYDGLEYLEIVRLINEEDRKKLADILGHIKSLFV